MAIVELEKISKRYSEADDLAVEDFNLTTEDGEFVVLVGPSGCGKTSTMRMIAGLEAISDGNIRIGGRDVSGMPPKDRDIAMVFQNYALYPHMNVFGNMAFGLRLRKLPKDEIKTQVHNAAQILNIEHLLERKPRELSGGQRQRVALGRAIVRQPQVFLMDEPLSNLDAKLRVDMRAEISKLHRRLGVTTFYVTHDQTEAMTMGQRIVVMRDGRVQQIDTPYNLYEQPVNRFVAGFIGNPSMNFLHASVDGDGTTLRGDGFCLKVAGVLASALEAHGQRELWAGIRPEHLKRYHGADTAGDNLVRGSVELVEPLGAVTMIQLSVNEHLMTAQLEGHAGVKPGDSITLQAESDKLHLFDLGSDDALARSH